MGSLSPVHPKTVALVQALVGSSSHQGCEFDRRGHLWGYSTLHRSVRAWEVSRADLVHIHALSPLGPLCA